MIKNRIIQLILQLVFCILGVIAIAASLGAFEAKFQTEFYLYFTNLSNYICIIIMFIELIHTIKNVISKENKFCSFNPALKFMGLIMIILTFLVYNVLLAKDMPKSQNLSIASILLHIVLPILYFLDWLLFYERKTAKWYYPIISFVVPILYVCFVFIRAALINGENNTLYPYFFLNIQEIGVSGMLKWNLVISAFILISAYILVFINHIGKSGKNN